MDAPINPASVAEYLAGNHNQRISLICWRKKKAC